MPDSFGGTWLNKLGKKEKSITNMIRIILKRDYSQPKQSFTEMVGRQESSRYGELLNQC